MLFSSCKTAFVLLSAAVLASVVSGEAKSLPDCYYNANVGSSKDGRPYQVRQPTFSPGPSHPPPHPQLPCPPHPQPPCPASCPIPLVPPCTPAPQPTPCPQPCYPELPCPLPTFPCDAPPLPFCPACTITLIAGVKCDVVVSEDLQHLLAWTDVCSPCDQWVVVYDIPPCNETGGASQKSAVGLTSVEEADAAELAQLVEEAEGCRPSVARKVPAGQSIKTGNLSLDGTVFAVVLADSSSSGACNSSCSQPQYNSYFGGAKSSSTILVWNRNAISKNPWTYTVSDNIVAIWVSEEILVAASDSHSLYVWTLPDVSKPSQALQTSPYVLTTTLIKPDLVAIWQNEVSFVECSDQLQSSKSFSLPPVKNLDSAEASEEAFCQRTQRLRRLYINPSGISQPATIKSARESAKRSQIPAQPYSVLFEAVLRTPAQHIAAYQGTTAYIDTEGTGFFFAPTQLLVQQADGSVEAVQASAPLSISPVQSSFSIAQQYISSSGPVVFQVQPNNRGAQAGFTVAWTSIESHTTAFASLPPFHIDSTRSNSNTSNIWGEGNEGRPQSSYAKDISGNINSQDEEKGLSFEKRIINPFSQGTNQPWGNNKAFLFFVEQPIDKANLQGIPARDILAAQISERQSRLKKQVMVSYAKLAIAA